MYRLIFVDDEDLIRDFFTEMVGFKKYGFELTAVLGDAENR